MATKTQQLRAALEARGFKRVESRSQRPCYTGIAKDGAPVWIWPDEVGGMRYARTERVGDAINGFATVKKVLAGLDSNILPLHPVALRIVPREPKSPVSREAQRDARSELKDAQRKASDELFEAAWAKLGYLYGADALEQVKLEEVAEKLGLREMQWHTSGPDVKPVERLRCDVCREVRAGMAIVTRAGESRFCQGCWKNDLSRDWEALTEAPARH